MQVTLKKSNFEGGITFNGKELTEGSLTVLSSPDEWSKLNEIEVADGGAGQAELWFTNSQTQLVYRVQVYFVKTEAIGTDMKSSVISGLTTAFVALVMTLAIFSRKNDGALTVNDDFTGHGSLENEVITHFHTRITGQRWWIAIEVGDFLSDFAAFVVHASSGNYDVLFILI